VHEGLQDAHLLPVAVRQRPDPQLQIEVEALRQLLDRGPPHPAPQRRQVPQVLRSGQVRVRHEVARQVADPPLHPFAVRNGVEAEHLGPARSRAEQPGEQPDRGGLAGTVRTEVAEHPAGRHLQVQSAQRRVAPVALRQLPRPDRYVVHARLLQL